MLRRKPVIQQGGLPRGDTNLIRVDDEIESRSGRPGLAIQVEVAA
jgi:hypothetical protein